MFYGSHMLQDAYSHSYLVQLCHYIVSDDPTFLVYLFLLTAACCSVALTSYLYYWCREGIFHLLLPTAISVDGFTRHAKGGGQKQSSVMNKSFYIVLLLSHVVCLAALVLALILLKSL